MARRVVARVATADLSTLQVAAVTLSGALVTLALLWVLLAIQAL